MLEQIEFTATQAPDDRSGLKNSQKRKRNVPGRDVPAYQFLVLPLFYDHGDIVDHVLDDSVQLLSFFRLAADDLAGENDPRYGAVGFDQIHVLLEKGFQLVERCQVLLDDGLIVGVETCVNEIEDGGYDFALVLVVPVDRRWNDVDLCGNGGDTQPPDPSPSHNIQRRFGDLGIAEFGCVSFFEHNHKISETAFTL